jgi:O-antigen/teichoic acid export membrane protein
VYADLLRAVLVFSIPILVPYHIAWLYVIVIMISAIGELFNPAYEQVNSANKPKISRLADAGFLIVRYIIVRIVCRLEKEE